MARRPRPRVVLAVEPRLLRDALVLGLVARGVDVAVAELTDLDPLTSADIVVTSGPTPDSVPGQVLRLAPDPLGPRLAVLDLRDRTVVVTSLAELVAAIDDWRIRHVASLGEIERVSEDALQAGHLPSDALGELRPGRLGQ